MVRNFDDRLSVEIEDVATVGGALFLRARKEVHICKDNPPADPHDYIPEDSPQDLPEN